MTDLTIINARTPELENVSVHIRNGLISDQPAQNAEIIDAAGALLLPAFTDLYSTVRFISSDLDAAAAGGISSLCTSPDSKPGAMTRADVRLTLQNAEKHSKVPVLPLGALTRDLEGEQLANMHSLMESGCIALSNAGKPISNSLIMQRLMEYATTHNITVFLTPEDAAMSNGGLMHEGATSVRLGLAGIPETAETIALAQQLLLAEQTGCRIHISRVSCARSVAMICEARTKGLKVTADVAVANLLYTDEHINGYNTCFRVQPPLRSESDRQALLRAVREGKLAVCSNHSPHEIAAKKATFADAEAGISSLDTWLSMMLILTEKNELSLDDVARSCALMPAEILNRKAGVETGEPASLVLIDTKSAWTVSDDTLRSDGKNTPMSGQSVPGKVLLTLSGGEICYRSDSE